MGRAKRSLLTVSSFVLSSFILFFEIIATAITSLAGPWGFLKQSLQHLIKMRNSLSEGLTEQYVQVIANSSISLMLALAIAHFQPQFTRILLFLSFEVHEKFLGVIVEVPKLSETLQNWEMIKGGLFYSYFLFGFLGISTQCILTVDLLALACLPTVIAFRIVVKMFKTCIKLFQNMLQILLTNKQGWLSCDYYQALLRDSTKLIYMSSIPVLCYAMAWISFYAVGLASTLLALRVTLNVIINIALGLDQVGFMLCLFKQYIRKTNQEETLLKQIEKRGKAIKWVPILTPHIFWQTLDGCWPLEQESNSFAGLHTSGEGWGWVGVKLGLSWGVPKRER